jgi:hypothetical protein
MKNELTIIPGTRIALFCSSGPVEFEDRMRNVERMAQFCDENSIKHLIVDIRQQESKTERSELRSFVIPQIARPNLEKLWPQTVGHALAHLQLSKKLRNGWKERI